MQASILLISESETLSFTRARLLHPLQTMIVPPENAIRAITLKAFDLIVICQSVPEDVAARLTLWIVNLRPAYTVMVINRYGERRAFGSIQVTVDLPNPQRLPDAVARCLPANG